MMTLRQAKKIGTIVGMADNGCEVCVGNLIHHLNETFPQFVWKMPTDAEQEAVEREPGDLSVAVQVAKAALLKRKPK